MSGTGNVVFDLNDRNSDQKGEPTPDTTKVTLMLGSDQSMFRLDALL
jgi:hypothetical protein